MKVMLTVKKTTMIPIKHDRDEGNYLGDVLTCVIMDHLEYENSRSERERAELSKIEVHFDDEDRARVAEDYGSSNMLSKNYKVVQ